MTVPLGGHTANIGHDEQDVPGSEGAEERGQRSSLSGPGGGWGPGGEGNEPNHSRVHLIIGHEYLRLRDGSGAGVQAATGPVARLHSALHRRPPRGQPSTHQHHPALTAGSLVDHAVTVLSRGPGGGVGGGYQAA